jgi:hypothetical protein
MLDSAGKLISTLDARLSDQNSILHSIAESLHKMESHLRKMALASIPAPDHYRPLDIYPTFDWSSINATVIDRDDYGYATTVEWNGQVFVRRFSDDLLRPTVWFSSRTGKDANSDECYSRLIAFTGTKATKEEEYQY